VSEEENRHKTGTDTGCQAFTDPVVRIWKLFTFPLRCGQLAKWGLTKQRRSREGEEKNRGKHDLMSALNQPGGQN